MKKFFNWFMVITFAVLMSFAVSCGNKTEVVEANDSIIEDTTVEDTTLVIEDEAVCDTLATDCEEIEVVE